MLNTRGQSAGSFYISTIEYIATGLIIAFLSIALLRGLDQLINFKLYSTDEERAFVQDIRREFFKEKEWTKEDYDAAVNAYRNNRWIRYKVFQFYTIGLLIISIAIPSIAMVDLFKKYRKLEWREKLSVFFVRDKTNCSGFRTPNDLR